MTTSQLVKLLDAIQDAEGLSNAEMAALLRNAANVYDDRAKLAN